MSFVLDMIAEGEHQQQDFKMRIEDARKIARTLVAFANADGGRLLIGVKDNGSVSGINPEEEFHMIEAAAEMYCKPPVRFRTQVWKANHRSVLEVMVEASSSRPHYAQEEGGDWYAYDRREDRNIRANGVLLKVWLYGKNPKPGDFRYTWRVKKLFSSLRKNERMTFRQLSRLLRMGRESLENLLAQLVAWEIIQMQFTDTGCFFAMPDDAGEEAEHRIQSFTNNSHE